jgi:3-methyladenine DNA glycosylase Tag
VDKHAIRELFDRALEYCEKNHSRELRQIRRLSPNTFKKMSVETFLGEYCHVLYTASFKESTVTKKFDQLRASFHDFNLDKICRMRTVANVLKIINNRLKAEGFVKGAKLIQAEGYENFKARVTASGMDGLRVLPFIKDITKQHLARNIGLADTYKEDVHLQRLARHHCATDVAELASYLAKATNNRQGVVDFVLWRYCADRQWKPDRKH